MEPIKQKLRKPQKKSSGNINRAKVVVLERAGLLMNRTLYDPVEFPELRLVKAVLARAIRDLCSVEKGITSLDRETAREWIFSNDIKAFSYLWVCDNTGVHPHILRERLSKLIGRIRFDSSKVKFLGDSPAQAA